MASGQQPTLGRGGRGNVTSGLRAGGRAGLRRAHLRSAGGGTGGFANRPNAPVQAAATPGDGTVALSWAAPTNLGGSAIVGYDVLRGTTTGQLTLLVSLGGAALAYDDDSAVNGTEYFYAIVAKNAAGSGPASNEESATPAL